MGDKPEDRIHRFASTVTPPADRIQFSSTLWLALEPNDRFFTNRSFARFEQRAQPLDGLWKLLERLNSDGVGRREVTWARMGAPRATLVYGSVSDLQVGFVDQRADWVGARSVGTVEG